MFRRKKKFHGEVFLWYMGGYGIIRAFVESMRTDQLILGNTGIPVSQLLAVLLAVTSTAIVVYMRIKKKDMPAIADIEDEWYLNSTGSLVYRSFKQEKKLLKADTDQSSRFRTMNSMRNVDAQAGIYLLGR